MTEINIGDFKEDQARLLQDFLAAPGRPEDTMGYFELAGFLFAISCSPELIKPSEWLPIIFDDQEPVYQSPDEAKEVLGAIMGLYNRITGEAGAGDVQLPPDCLIQGDPLANLGTEAPLCQWSAGFIGGHNWLDVEWADFLPDDLEDEFNAIMLVLSFFANRKFSEDVFREAQLEHNSQYADKTFEDMAAKMMLILPDAMELYAQMGLMTRQILNDLELYEKAFSDGPRPGRNEPCPCGSGKKYKKCCEAAEAPVPKTATDKLYQLKITLKGSKPPIWRRIVVPDTTLDNLSDYLLTAMGWVGGHLHAIRALNKYYGIVDPEWGMDDMIDESTVILSDIVSPRNKKFTYDYDFGDGWEHEVLVEKELVAQAGASYPVCLTGRCACPPEDVGGIYGYYEFLEVIADTDHPDYEELLEWIGGSFDPAAFDLEETNEALNDVALNGGWWVELD